MTTLPEDAAYRDAFTRYLRSGVAGIASDDMAVLQRGFVSGDELLDQCPAAGGAGGFLVPEVFRRTLVDTLKSDLAASAQALTQPTAAPPARPPSPPAPNRLAQPNDVPAPGEFDQLRVLAESYEDIQRVRIGIEHRVRALAIPLDPVAPSMASLADAERQLALAMRHSFRRAAPEVRAWVLDTPGLGEHLMARLLGVIGHPVLAQPYHWEGEGEDRHLVEDPPYLRSVSQLWSYCGHGDPARRKRKGMSAGEAAALGTPRAKMLAHLIAEGAMKCTGTANPRPTPELASPAGAPQSNGDGANDPARPTAGSPRRRSPYRDTYDLARARYADEDQWASDAHRHNSALRVTAKVILKDLWIVARAAL